MATTCSGALTLGSVTTNPAGTRPQAPSNWSRVRSARSRVGASRLLIRTPQPAVAGSRNAPPTRSACCVLLVVGPHAVAVLEVDAQVLDGLALELRHHPAIDVGVDAEARGVGCVLAERGQRSGTPLRRRRRREPVCRHVRRVHRLPLPSGRAPRSQFGVDTRSRAAIRPPARRAATRFGHAGTVARLDIVERGVLSRASRPRRRRRHGDLTVDLAAGGQTGNRCGSRPGTQTLPHSAMTGSPDSADSRIFSLRT